MASEVRRGKRGEAFRSFVFYFSENKGALVGLGFFVCVVCFALFAHFIAPHNPMEVYKDSVLQPPVWQKGGSWDFLLGTDGVGRDILSRIIYGSRYSLAIACIVILASSSLGLILGLVAGFVGGYLDIFVVRVMDIVFAIPPLLFALVLVTLMGASFLSTVVAIAIPYLPYFARLSRASMLTEKSKDYVTASRLVGASRFRRVWFVILPNCLPPLIVQATMNFSNAILDAAALGFLGLGVQPPLPEWGAMLSTARDTILTSWWATTWPGLSILLTVLAVNLLGDGLRDALDPKLKRS